MEEFHNKMVGDLEITENLREIDINDLLVSYNFSSLYPSAQVDNDSTWPAIDTVYAFKRYMNDAVGELFNNGKWD